MAFRVPEAVAVATMRAAGLEPVAPFPGSNDSWPCRCRTCGHEVAPTYQNVKRLGVRCKYCSGRAVHPTDAVAKMRSAGAEPVEPYKSKDAPWRCTCMSCGREITPSYGNIRRGQTPCIYCANRTTDIHEALQVMAAAGFEPLVPFPGAKVGWSSRCTTCDSTVTPSLSGVRRGRGCRVCAGQVVDVDEAVAVMRAAQLEPLVTYPGANEPWLCRCGRCGRDTAPSFGAVRRGSSCRYCAQKAVVPDEAVALMRSRGFEPLDTYPGAHAPWLVRCTACHRTFETMYSYVRTGTGCRYCTGKEIVPGEAVKFMRSVGLEPLEPYPGANNRWRCRCTTCQQEVAPTYTNVSIGGKRCRFCATYGIDYTAPGIIYLLRSDDWFVLKIGVTTRATKTSRVERHEGYGWKVVAQWDVPTGDDAERIESLVLSWWRDIVGAPIAMTREQMPQGGWSETASLLWVDEADTVQFVERCLMERSGPESS